MQAFAARPTLPSYVCLFVYKVRSEKVHRCQCADRSLLVRVLCFLSSPLWAGSTLKWGKDEVTWWGGIVIQERPQWVPVCLQGAVWHASGCYKIPAWDKSVCMCVLSCVNTSERLRELAQRGGWREASCVVPPHRALRLRCPCPELKHHSVTRRYLSSHHCCFKINTDTR